jgi:hypothetical protein
VVLLMALLSPHAALAAPEAPQQTMTAALQVSQIYSPYAWQPVLLQFRNNADRAVDGAAVVPTGSIKAPAVMRVPLSVPAHSTVRVTVWATFAPVVQRQKGSTPALAVTEWRASDGALLARADMLGFPLTGAIESEGNEGKSDAAESAESGEMFLVVNQRADADEQLNDYAALVAQLKDLEGLPHTSATVEVIGLPSNAAGLRAFKAIALEGVDPESLDVAQRAPRCWTTSAAAGRSWSARPWARWDTARDGSTRIFLSGSSGRASPDRSRPRPAGRR